MSDSGSPTAVAAAAGASVVHMELRKLAVRIGHELLELILKVHGALGLDGTGIEGGGTVAGRRSGGSVVLEAALTAFNAIPALVIVLGTGRGRRGLLDGEIDALAVIDTDDLDLDLLSFLKVVVDVIDVRIGDFRDMYQSGLIVRQRNECAELGDAGNFTFQDGTYF